MNSTKLQKITTKRKRHLGRGHGSGRGKTAGRGTKGQKARGSIPAFFEGGAITIIKRLPMRRGKGRHKRLTKKPIAMNVKVLNLFPKGTTVDEEALIKKRIVDESDARAYGVKILGDGELFIPLTVKVPVSKGAKRKIEKAGGSVLNG